MSHVPKSAEFSLYPSVYFLYAKLGLALVAALLIGLSPILLCPKLAGLLLLIALCYYFFRHFRQQKPERLVVLPGDSDYWCLVSLDNGNAGFGDRAGIIELQLMPSQFVSEPLVILYFRTLQGKRIHRVIPADSLAANEHRLLRKLLLARSS